MVSLPPASLSASVLDALPYAVVVTGLDGAVRYANPAAHRLYAYGDGEFVGANAVAALTADEDRRHAAGIVARVRGGDVWTGDFPIRRGDGTTVRLQVTASPLVDGGEVVGIVGVGEPLPAARYDSVMVSRLVDLAQLVAAVGGAADLQAAGDIVTSSAATVLGAEAASLSILDGPDHLRLLAVRSARPFDRQRWAGFAVGDDNPISEAVRTGRTVTASDAAELHLRWPDTYPEDSGRGSLVVVPLLVADRCIGALALAFPEGSPLEETDHRYLEALADSCAQAVERITATAEAADSAAKLTFLAEASEALAVSLDYEATLRTVADLAVPRLADWCAIDVLEEGQLRRVAVSHVDPAKVDLAWQLLEEYPPDMDAPTGAPAVARTGTSELVEEVDERLLDALDLEPKLRQLVYDLQLRSALTVALRARGRTLGVLGFVYAESGRHYGPGDVRFAEDLARRAAVAIDNSQLHTETLQAALQLQRAVLPDSFADSDTWRVAVHYRPAGRTEVGGDFFDALTLDDGRMIALVGDVMGRGVAAAAAMAQVRSAVRAFLTDDPDPAAVLRRLDRMFAALDLPQLVTLVYTIIDPRPGRLLVASAGHLPPLLLRAGGQVERLVVPPSPPLGAWEGVREIITVPFGPADILLAYSDGLVERRGEDLDDGLNRLVARARGLRGQVSDAALAAMADELRQAGHDDDVTVLAVQPLPHG